jgi:integrase
MAYGSIVELENGKYRVCFDYGIGGNGKRVRKYRTFSSKPEATKALNKHRVQMDNNSFAVPRNICLSEWIEYWYENIINSQIERTTAYGYNNIIKNYLKPNLGAYKLQKLSPENIQKYYTKLLIEEELSPNTVIKHHNLLTNILNAAKRYEYIVRNPMEAVSPPKKNLHEARFYTSEQLGQLLMLVQGTRLELAVNLCAYLGLRRGELCGLCWSNVDFENHNININHTRTAAGKTVIEKDTKTVSSNRVLFMPETLERLLQHEYDHQKKCVESLYNAYDNNDFVAVMEDGKPFRPNYLSELFTKFLRDNGLPEIVLHELRHTFASLSNEAGIPSFNIGKALGHASPSITQKIYTHILDQTHSSAVQGVAVIADQMRKQAKAKRDAPIADRIRDVITQWDPMGIHEYGEEIARITENIFATDTADKLSKLIFNVFRDSFGSRNFSKTVEECISLADDILSTTLIMQETRQV